MTGDRRDIALDETAAGDTPPRETQPSIAARAGEHGPTLAAARSPASTTLSGSRPWATPARAVFLGVAAVGVINVLYFVVRFMIAADPPSLHESFRGTSTAAADPFAASGIFYGPQLTLARTALIAAVFLPFATWISQRHRGDPLMQLLAAMTVMAGQYSMSVAVLTSSEDLPLWRGIAAMNYVVLPAGALVFLAVFPSGRSVPRWGVFLVPLGVIPFAVQCANMLVYRGFSVPVAGVMFLVMGVFLGFQGHRYRRRASLREQHQILWMSFAGIAFLGIQLVAVVAILPVLRDPARPGFQLLKLFYEFLIAASYLVALASALFSAARYRLWDIDRVINRAIVYVVVSALVAAAAIVVFFALDASLRGVLETSATVSALISALVSIALFQPIRRRISRWIDRRFYGIGVDYEALAAKAVRAAQHALPTSASAFANYDELVLLGRGGMGAVYRAHHPDFGVPVALKVMSPALASDRDAQARFLREALVLEALVHPNVVPFLASGHDGGLAFIAMQYLEGEDLAAVLRRHHRVRLEDALPVLHGIAAALDLAHDKGIVHRDVKPANIFLEGTAADPIATRPARLMDFGVAHFSGGSPGADADDDSLVGSLHYIAPEQIHYPNRVDGRADIYAFAATTYEMLTGRPPFLESTALGLVMAHLHQPPADPRELEASVPASAAAALLTGLDKQRDRRFVTAGAFVAALHDATR
ncbi:MAG: serine/threonine protein kinase [Deltaproteobacteria bacterium]|nr:serine/threonine protein kinase [Deltaproteobacteria bacterium]MDQ3295623.1 serine/threonine protein kinase [Myxococcota bacterium]